MKRYLLLPLLYLLTYNASALDVTDKLANTILENDLFLTKILRSDNEQYYVEVSIKDLIIKETCLFGEKYNYIYSVDCDVDNAEGSPTLPIIRWDCTTGSKSNGTSDRASMTSAER